MSALAEDTAGADILLRADAGGVATLTLNRPQARNALSLAMIAALQDQLDALAADDTVRVVVIAANGPGFCAGHDLKEVIGNNCADANRDLMAKCARMMLTVTRLPKPVIAKVHGIATAAGCQLVASCDLAVAADSAKFATPGVNIGLFCSTPMVPLSRAVGRKHAMEMLLTGNMISAARAAEIGLINKTVADGQLDAAVADLADHIAGKSAYTLAIGKEAFYRQIEMGLDDAYAYAGEVMVTNMGAQDADEGITAFIEKRAPHWKDA